MTPATLHRLGEPEEIVGPELPAPAPDRRGTREWAAIILLLLGGFAFGVGWIAGLILLWSSRAWSTVDKWIGTLILPGGLAASAIVLSTAALSSGGGGEESGPSAVFVAALVVLVLSPLATSVYLALRAR